MSLLSDLFADIFRHLVLDPLERREADRVNKLKPGEHPTAVHNGKLHCIGGVVVAAIFAPVGLLVACIAAISKPPGEAVFIVPLFGGVAVWMIIAAYDGFVRRITWTEAEVHFRKWNSDRTVPWTDIVALEEKSHPPHIRIGLRDGSGFGIGETMYGSRYFMRLVERRLDPDGTGRTKRRRRRDRGKKRQN